MMDAITLDKDVWHPYEDVETFRYRISWKLRKGHARHISERGMKQKKLSFWLFV